MKLSSPSSFSKHRRIRMGLVFAGLCALALSFQNCASDFDETIYTTNGVDNSSRTDGDPGNDPGPPAGPNIPAYSLRWSFDGTKPAGHAFCTVFLEPAEDLTRTWNDNQICADQDLDLRFISNAPVGGPQDPVYNHCVQISEGSDPDSWANNWLCSSKELGMKWSFLGPISGMTCVNVDEPAEVASATWEDNYLCFPSTNPQVIVAAPFVLMAPQNHNTTVMSFEAVTMAVSAYGRNLTYKWYFKSAFSNTEVLLPTQTSSSVVLNPASLNNAGRYRVVVSNSAGSVEAAAVLDVYDDSNDFFN